MKNYCGLLIFVCLAYPATSQVKFVIESLPETTPPQDSIFITGTFNNWNTTDPMCLLRKQPNGQLSVVLEFEEPVVEYKFTRGDWLKVETGEDNQYIPNRTYVQNQKSETLPIQILNWQDLGGARSFEYLAFYYFATALMSVILLILSSRIIKKKGFRRQVFAMLHGALALAFFGFVAYNIVNPIWQTYLLIISQTAIFAWGPMLYFFVGFLENRNCPTVHYLHFLPVGLAVSLATLRLMNLEILAFFATSALGILTWGKLLMIGVGGLITCWFFIQALKKINWDSDCKIHTYLRAILIINGMGLCLVFISLCADAWILKYIGDFKWLFILLSGMIWIEVIWLWKEPQFFKEKPHIFHIDKANELLSELKVLMDDDKVYHEPELNLNRLAELTGTKPHVLSKLLNEHFQQNFRDYVNGYRVKEFIVQAEAGKLEKLTYLGLAHEVGFNSKSTFNLAFKKITNKSPREYFKSFAV